MSCVEEWVAESPWREELVPTLPWVHLAYNQFKSRLQNFSRILAVHPRVTGYLLPRPACRAARSQMVNSLFVLLSPGRELCLHSVSCCSVSSGFQ